MALLPADEVARFASDPDRAGLRRTLTGVNTGRLAWLPDSSQAGLRFAAATLALAGDSVIAAALPQPSGTAQRDSMGGPLAVPAAGLINALRSRGADLRERTVRLDSMVRWVLANEFTNHTRCLGYEGLLLSVAWERLGEAARALSAVQLDRWELNLGILLAPRLRQEGRLAAIVGDTTRAIRAYHRYLSLRRDADPVLIPERDSVQAALARLERRR